MWPFAAKKPTRDAWWLGGILVLALAIRLVNVATQPYWSDELLSLDVVTQTRSVGEMLRYVSQVEFHPPLYYLLLRPWVALFGPAEAATRALSILASLGCVALAYVMGRRMLGDRRAGLVAAFVMALLPMQVRYAQEARPYALLGLVGMLAMLAAWEWQREGKATTAALYVAAMLAGLYLHYSFVLLAVPVAVWLLARALMAPRDRRWRAFLEWFAAHAAIFLGFFPWLTFLLYKILLGAFPIFGETLRSNALRPPDVPFHILDQLVWTSSEKLVPAAVQLGKLAFLMVVPVAVAAAVRRPRDGKDADRDRAAVAYLAWIAAAALALFIFAPQSVPYSPVYERHLIFATAPLALLLAALVARLTVRKGTALLAIFAVSLVPFLATTLGDDSEWDPQFAVRALGEYVNAHYAAGDLVIVATATARSDVQHYLPSDARVAALMPLQYYDLDVWRRPHLMGLVENESQVRFVAPTEAEVTAKIDRLAKLYQPKRVWLVYFTSHDLAAHRWFADRGWRQAFREIGDLFPLDLYVAPTPSVHTPAAH